MCTLWLVTAQSGEPIAMLVEKYLKTNVTDLTQEIHMSGDNSLASNSFYVNVDIISCNNSSIPKENIRGWMRVVGRWCPSEETVVSKVEATAKQDAVDENSPNADLEGNSCCHLNG